MSICMFGHPIVSDENAIYLPTFSGGSWSGTLPLTNLQDRRLAKIARSTAATLASTQFDVDLKRAARVGLIALPGHTISTAGKVRVRGFSAVPIFDSLTVGDAAWTATGTPTRTAAAFTSADGVQLDLIGDDGATQEDFYRAVTFTGNGTKAIRFRVAKSSSYAFHRVDVYDTATPANRLVVYIDFTTTTPVLNVATGTLVSLTDRGDGSWDIVCTIPGIIAANAHRLYVFPAQGGAADTASLYIGAFLLWDAATDQLAYEGGFQDVWPAVYPAGSLAAGDPRLVTGKYTAEEAAEINIGFTHIPSAIQTARYWRIEIDDTTNAAGYVDIGRLVMATTYQPTINMSEGAEFALTSASTRTETDGGAAVHQDKPRRRSQAFSVEDLPEDEALVNFWDMQRRIGTAGQLYFVHNPADTHHLHRRSFLGTLQELTKLRYPFGTRASVPFAVIEEL